MSETAPTKLPDGKFDWKSLGFLPHAILGIGIVAIIISLIWGRFLPRQFAFSWLVAFMYSYTICAGCLFWILLHHSVDAQWSVVVRRLLENVAALFPWLILLFIPLWWHREWIWRWMTVNPTEDILYAHKQPFLDGGIFYYSRIAFYFLFFAGAACLFRKFSLAQDVHGDPRLSLRMRRLSNGCIILFALCITFSAFDWLMALDHHWVSTMWGVYIFAGSAHASMALCILISNYLLVRGYLKGVMSEEHNHIMGKLLLAFTIFWAYIGFSQYFLIYYANIPEETQFYAHRNMGTWYYVSIFLVIGRFIFPFILLLTQPAKKNPRRICFAAGWILMMHLVDLYWIIMPQLQVNEAIAAGKEAASHGLAPHLLDGLALIGVLGVLFYFFVRGLSKHAIFPIRDPRLAESIALKNY